MNAGHTLLIICSFFARYPFKMTSERIFRQGMNKNSIMVFACGILLVACLAGNAQAQTIEYEDHVVINEVEIGDQMQNDWVELYNPTSEVVDIGGWVISSFLKGHVFLKGGQTFTIPSDTVLNPGEFIVYERQEDWFSFQSALVQIHNMIFIFDGLCLCVPGKTCYQKNATCKYHNGVFIHTLSEYSLRCHFKRISCKK